MDNSRIKVARMVENVDRISQLPTCLLHNILFHLSPREQARTCVLSKSWKTLVWSSLPERSFYLIQGKEVAPACTNDTEKHHIFVNLVDQRLQRLQNERFKIPEVEIVIVHLDSKISVFIDRWLQLLFKNHVGCLALSIKHLPEITYMFPKIALASTVPLKTLKLRGCKLQRSSLCDDDHTDKVVYLSMKRLSLGKVVVDNQDNIFQNFISRCPSLLYLSFKSCFGVKHLRLCNHPKLEVLRVYVNQDVTETEYLERVEVDSLHLHTLTCSCSGVPKRPLIVEATRCRNIQRLCLISAKLEDHYLKNLSTNFPILETLSLGHCTGLKDVEVLHHPMLKRLRLRYNDMGNLDVIDAPNLLSFDYGCSNLVPSKLSPSNALSSSMLLKDFYLKLSLAVRSLEASRFLELRAYLGQFNKHNVTVSLLISGSREFNFTADELRGVPYNIEHLKLQFSRSSLSYDALVDGLFWSFRPKSVLVKKTEERDIGFVKNIYQILTAAKEKDGDPDCCSSHDLKCWRHFLKDFTVNDRTGVNLLEPLQNFANRNEAVFTLNWF